MFFYIVLEICVKPDISVATTFRFNFKCISNGLVFSWCILTAIT